MVGPSNAGSYCVLHGELDPWPSKLELAALLEAAGFRVHVGRYSVRLDDCDHFKFQEYGGDLGEPRIEADADSLEAMRRDAGRVSAALAKAQIRHRFELYDGEQRLVGYLHHRWPGDVPPA